MDGTTTCANPGWAWTIQEAINGAIMNAIQAIIPVIVVPPSLYDERLNVGGSAAVRIVAGTSAGSLAFGGTAWEVRRMAAQSAPAAPVVRPSIGGSVITIEPGSELILDGFVLEGGTGTPIEIEAYNPVTGQIERRTVNSGAGIVNKGVLTLRNSRLTDNDAGQLGSILFTGVGAYSEVADSTISGNSGSAIRNLGETAVSDTTIDGNRYGFGNCIVGNDLGASMAMTDGSVTANEGTGVCNSGELVLTRTTIDRNDQIGVFNANSIPGTTTTLTMRGGSLSGNAGMGLMSWTASTTLSTVEDVEISGNGATGLYRGAGNLNVTGGRIADNRNGGVQNAAHNLCYNAGTGAGTVCSGPDTRVLTLTDVDVTGNSGAIAIRNGDGAHLALVDVDVTANAIGNPVANAIMNGDWSHPTPNLPAVLTMTGGSVSGNTGGIYAISTHLATTTLTGVSIRNTPIYNGYSAILQMGGAMTVDRLTLDGGLSAAADCWQRPCTDALLVNPLTTVRDSAFGGLEPHQGVSVPYGTIDRSTFTNASIQGGCDTDIRDSTLTGSAIIGVCYSGGVPGPGRIAISGVTSTGAWAGFWNVGVTATLSAAISGASTGVIHQAGTTAIGPDSRITGNTVGVRNESADPAAITGVNPTTVFGNETDCIGVAGCP
ncbi:MAG: hypothetical protein ACKOWF_10725 [Chloroflexota bacterium]